VTIIILPGRRPPAVSAWYHDDAVLEIKVAGSREIAGHRHMTTFEANRGGGPASAVPDSAAARPPEKLVLLTADEWVRIGKATGLIAPWIVWVGLRRCVCRAADGVVQQYGSFTGR
jgi:hypothetical protein